MWLMTLLNRLLLMLLLLALLLLLGARSQTKENIVEAREHVSPRALSIATTAAIDITTNLRRVGRPVELQRARRARDARAPAGALDGHRAPRARSHRVGEEDGTAAESGARIVHIQRPERKREKQCTNMHGRQITVGCRPTHTHAHTAHNNVLGCARGGLARHGRVPAVFARGTKRVRALRDRTRDGARSTTHHRDRGCGCGRASRSSRGQEC